MQTWLLLPPGPQRQVRGRWGWRAPASAANPLPATCRPDFIRWLVVTQNSQLASIECETCREPSLRGLWKERRRRCSSRSKDQDRCGDPGQCRPEAGRGRGESGNKSDPLVPAFSSSPGMAFVLDLQGRGIPSPPLLGLSKGPRSSSLGV